MPELAEVEYFRKLWNPGLGLGIVRVTVHPWTRIFRDCAVAELVKGLPGSCLQASESHGKQMLFRTDRQGWLGVHLGMTGSLSYSADSDFDDRYSHFVIQVEDGYLIFDDPRQFGRVRYETGDSAPRWWSELPPQVLSEAFTLAYFNNKLDRRKGSQLKPLMLVQEFVPGIGNWMADEILWRARLNPARKVESLSDYERETLYEQTRWVSRYALRIVGDDWGDFPNTWLFNHRWKDGGLCPLTEKPLKRESIGGRTTCWSPAWQS